MRCVDIGEKKRHAGYRANKALREQTGGRSVAYSGFLDKVIDSYWVPLADVDDIFEHFGIDFTEYAAGRLFPKVCTSGTDCSSCVSNA